MVSVVIPVYNVESYLRQTIDSVLDQTLGRNNLEVVAVDDGSTDGSAELLDSYAQSHPQVRVFHEPNSGGPGRPRNVGLDHARGRYVFFLDADDYLGIEALERLVAMAERNRSDVVMGKVVGIDGRFVARRAYRRTLDRAKLSDVYSTLAVMRLFRRSLIDRVGTRFDEKVEGGEDSPFTAELMLNADVISVVADYDCYYCREPSRQRNEASPHRGSWPLPRPHGYPRRHAHAAATGWFGPRQDDGPAQSRISCVPSAVDG